MAIREVTDVVPVTRQVNVLALGNIVEQAIAAANESLKKEFIDQIEKVSIEITSIKQQNEGVDLKSHIAELQKRG